jgi:hypothetical protein
VDRSPSLLFFRELTAASQPLVTPRREGGMRSMAAKKKAAKKATKKKK